MGYSIRGLFGVSAIVAMFIAAIYSRSDLAVLLTALFFVLLILLGTALAFVPTASSTFWRAFAVVAIGTVLLSPQIALFESLSYSINAQVRPPQSLVYTYSTASFPPPTAPGSTFVPSSTSQGSWPASMPQPTFVPTVTLPNYSTGSGINEQLEKLLIVGSALLLGIVGAVIIETIVGKRKVKLGEVPTSES